MAEPLSDIEKQLLRIRETEQRIDHLREHIARLKNDGQPTGTHDELLATYQDSLSLHKDRLTRLTVSVSYRCYLMLDNRIEKPLDLQCVDDADAMLQATETLITHAEYDSAELWCGARIVARIPRP